MAYGVDCYSASYLGDLLLCQRWIKQEKVTLRQENKSDPARQSAGPLSVRTAGGDRSRYTSLSERDALSNELQRYAIRNLD